MKIHRFYTGDRLKLKQDFWVHEDDLLWQWGKVLRFKPGQKIILFDGLGTDRMYELKSISAREAHLHLVTDIEPKHPKNHVYLFWSLIKSDKNDLVIQKCTELGVNNFVPIVAERSMKTGFNLKRAEKIALEASEQCGRSNIPDIREPISLEELIEEYKDMELFVCHLGYSEPAIVKKSAKVGVIIGPEGGFTDEEIKLLVSAGAKVLELGDLTLRAETASIIASSKFL